MPHSPLPDIDFPPLTGNFFSTIWYRFFAGLISAPGPVVAVTVGASPYSYEAPHRGTVFVSGGTVSAISITRGSTTFATGVTAGPIPVGAGDTAIITYSVLPTVNFAEA